ncbi:FAD-dependent oxidoreductase [Paenibacillus pinihumi]|uniref:FAD-dependent oxidoreductase n=1 Tax=Paenibacillus pinihumi TaxID=669462 RepID=UPI00040B5EC9
MEQQFAAEKRLETLKAMASEELDVLVIGGGITGAGIILDAQTRGMKAGLVEMQDFAAGTSSRSTKLVHGGLRYLKQFEIKMVAEVGKEREVVYENGPHVTIPEWMLFPFYKGGTFGAFTTSIGLRLYDYLAGVKKSERRKMLGPDETARREPLLKRGGLKGGGYYVEYRTDDARLTIEVMKKAVEHGAKAVNYAKAEDFHYEGCKLTAVLVSDRISGESFLIRARKIVNATGPWVDLMREKDRSKKGKMLRLTKGIHLVFDGNRFPLHQAIYFDTPDGRMVFAIPRDGKTYVGTTDTDYSADRANPRMTDVDRNYVLEAANYMFPELKLTAADVESSWAGLRPLIYQEGKSPSEISRRDEILHSESGLFTIAGGKLTGYRKMAEHVTDMLQQELEAEGAGTYQGCLTKKLPLSGGEVGGSAGFAPFLQQQIAAGMKLGLTGQTAELLTRRYGANISKVYQLIADRSGEAESYGMPAGLYAALRYGIEQEMVLKPADFFVRRTGALFFDIKQVKLHKEQAIQFLADKLHYTAAERMKYAQELDQLLHEAVTPAAQEADYKG